GVFINYGLQAEHVARARGGVGDGARAAGRTAGDLDEWWIACLDVSEKRETALEKLGNILGFVAAYVVGPDPAGRGVPAELVPAVQEMRRTYTTRRADMDQALLHRLGLFDYLRRRLAVAGTPDDCIAQAPAGRRVGWSITGEFASHLRPPRRAEGPGIRGRSKHRHRMAMGAREVGTISRPGCRSGAAQG